MQLHDFLDNKPLFYDEIDYTRMPRVYEAIKSHFKLPKIIHIVGTNGKGTTGRFLAGMLLQNGLKVGHYTSPHILKFNERIWVDGVDIDDVTLEFAHKKLLSLLEKEDALSLSYFEYTTLLAMLVFCEKCDIVVLEAGLGGEFDATNVFDKELSIVTPIGLDHLSFLGDTIKDIATTKINSVRNSVVVAKQSFQEVYEIANKRASEYGAKCILVEHFFGDEKNKEIAKYSQIYLQENFKTALVALDFFGCEFNFKDFLPLRLNGRCQKIAPNITIDVGHNTMAATALREAFGEKKISLVYNSYKDKDFRAILNILKPIVEELFIIDIESSRAVEQELLYESANALDMKASPFVCIEEEKEYLVFGSFSVVEAFLRRFNEK